MQTTTTIHGGIAVIRLHGRFDFNSHGVFRESCSASMGANEVRELELDLGGVDYIDSSALGMLLILREKAEAVHKTVTLANSRGTVKQVLAIANFATRFNMR